MYGAKELGLTQRFDSAPTEGADKTWVFIYGGSSGVGQFGIQLAKLSSYKVVTVASPRNHEFLRGLGADAIFDVCTLTLRSTFSIPVADMHTRLSLQYRDPDMVQKVKDVAGNKISHVLDTVAGNDTQLASVKVLAEDKAGKVVIVLPHVEGIQDVRKDVQVTSPSTPESSARPKPLTSLLYVK